MDRVLIVEKDAAVIKTLCMVLKGNDLEAEVAGSGEDALTLFGKNTYSLIFLDSDEAGAGGYQMIEMVRSRGMSVPIILMGADPEGMSALYGLAIGADDYVAKPFNPVMMGARARALIRLSRGHADEKDKGLSCGPFLYNTSTLKLYKNGAEIILTGRENALMKLFLDNKGRVFTRDRLYDLVWGNALVDDNAVMVYINRLRRKIEDDPDEPRFIETVRGLGYRFVV